MLATTADYELEMRGETLVVHPTGQWTIDQAGDLDGRLASDVAALMQTATSAVLGQEPERRRQWYDAFARVGAASIRFWNEFIETLAFIGQFFVVLVKVLASPKKLRWRAIINLIEHVGLDAAPIVMVLSFFIGAVIAYMGANLLAEFGASVFMVDLVGFSVLRELAVIITAILQSLV